MSSYSSNSCCCVYIVVRLFGQDAVELEKKKQKLKEEMQKDYQLYLQAEQRKNSGRVHRVQEKELQQLR